MTMQRDIIAPVRDSCGIIYCLEKLNPRAAVETIPILISANKGTQLVAKIKK